ncbi:MAG: type II toxin-antitoxin system Phd/YefM family antitoxin [Deltaproteobacteria bacterium]|nr:type II toxin-antitoxin system Phd/YefM family antitoxin [Deltaproteobacteria bacterium]
MAYSATDLRKDIYKVLDRILETGEPIEVERKGRLLRITPITRTSVMERLRVMDELIVGDPATLEHVDWSSEWKP